MANRKACQEINENVIKAGLCTLCGACTGLCPYFTAYEGRVLLRDVCDLDRGRCHAFCPRCSVDLDRLSEAVHGVPYSLEGSGPARRVVMARASDGVIRKSAQDAGVVTALTDFALSNGFIDAAVLTGFNDRSWPTSVIASSREEIRKCSGSSYLAAPTVAGFNKAAQEGGAQRIGFVGTPCQALALAKMRTAPQDLSAGAEKIALVIGLFCTWALAHPDFSNFLKERVSEPILRYEVPPHPANAVWVYTESGRLSFDIDEILPFVRPACRFCLDLTAEFADVAVGGGRGDFLNWNTVIARTEQGVKLLDSAIEKGVLEIASIPEENLKRLNRAAANKRKKAIRNILDRTGNGDDLLYLKIEAERVRGWLAAEEGSV
jgi:coenzyme F420 hydrogenase subunit beta